VAWRVRWTEPAWSNLEAAAAYIAQDSPRYAASFVRETRDAARSLRQFANRGRVVPEIGDPAVRELFVFRQTYRMLYRVLDTEVLILALIHGARDLPTALRE
jgi:plasmid stabilization system protein ParE